MQVLADESRLAELIDQLAEMISTDIAAQPGAPWALVGIRSRGDVLAERLAKVLDGQALAGRVGCLDITLYRDDLSEIGNQPIVRITDIPFSIDSLNVVLLDDVMMTGRSIRAALQSLMDFGRPRRVWLGVLVDRGGRELPIAPDFVALDLSHDPSLRALPDGDLVDVHLKPTDDEDAIVVRHPATEEGPA